MQERRYHDRRRGKDPAYMSDTDSRWRYLYLRPSAYTTKPTKRILYRYMAIGVVDRMRLDVLIDKRQARAIGKALLAWGEGE